MIFFYVIVDIQQLFTVIFSKTNLLSIILNYVEEINSSTSFCNIIQSPLWKKKIKDLNPDNKENIILIPVIIYFDDFEILNPLGSHSGQEKIGGLYIKILALPEHLNSKLSTIFLAMLFFTEDRKKFGNEKIFKKLIEKLNVLQNQGITLNGKIIKIVPCMVGGDNLGINSILGFVESFKSNCFCRFCNCHSNETKLLCKENISKLKNKENLNTDFQIFGVKENSILNSLDNFHTAENFCVDIMHDLLEGVCHYDILLILKKLVLEKQLLSIELLNKRIELFDFGPNNVKPPLFDTDCLSKTKFKLTASEMLIIVKYFPILIGDLVKNNVEWKLFLYLRELIYILFKKSISFGTHIYLKSLIENHKNYSYTFQVVV